MRDNVGKNKKARPTDFLSSATEYVSKEVQEERFSICAGCPELMKLTNQCKLCGCFMKLKVKLAHAECPAGKWGSLS
jgi:hypothetical protein